MSLQRIAMFSIAAAAALWASSDQARADGRFFGRTPELFENYYEDEGTIGSRLYPSPRPAPAWVGHTYYTYQPFYRHHHLYSHYDVYRRGTGPRGIIPTTTTRAFYW